jgi:predicted GIY-YIG superfamily endonuclease
MGIFHRSGRRSRTVRYTYLGKHRRPLYVGVTNNPARRHREHRASKPWFPQVKKVKTKHYRTRARALHAERRAIARKHPQYNIQHRR